MRRIHIEANHKNLWLPGLIVLLLLLISTVGVRAQTPGLTIEMITWDVIGLDSNRPAAGPYLFPVGARICNTTASAMTNVVVDFNWLSANANINLRPGSLTQITFTTLAAGACTDAYFEAQITQVAGAYDTTRRYSITASGSVGATTYTATSPQPRELFVEHLISQNRNVTSNMRFGTTPANLTSVAAGGSMNLFVGNTYLIELTASTATQGYEQLETFITLTNTVFQVLGVSTTYSANTAPAARVTSPHDQLYADACLWEADPGSPNYKACLDSSKKSGGNIVVTYTVKILGGGGTTQGLNSLIYDFSGSSFHYNSDYSTGARFANIIDPTLMGISKQFSPATTTAGGVSTLIFTLTNPNATAVSGYNFTDPLPAGVVVAATPSATTSGCGTPTFAPTAGATTLSFSNGTVAGNGTCTISVKVTAAAVNTYNNISNNLFIDSSDTGKNATATLTVNTAPAAPACISRNMATWTFAGTPSATAPAPATSTVTASASAGPGLGVRTFINTSLNEATTGGAANSWETDSIPNVATLNTANNDYFEFSLDTTGFTSVTMAYQAQRSQQGAQNVQLYYGTTGQTASGAPLSLTAQNTWFAFNSGAITTGLNANGATLFRLYVYNASVTNTGHSIYIDGVTFTGCAPPVQPPITKSFSPNPIAAGGTSTLTFTLANSNGVNLTSVQFSDTLPTGMTVAGTPAATNTCGGTWTTTAGSGTVSLTGATIPASGSCTLSVNVTSSTAGPSTNISGFISSTESGVNNTATGSATATLMVVSPPQISKSFAPDSILPGGTSRLTLTITNPNPSNAISGVAFTDPLPAGVSVAATPGAATNGCGTPTFAPASGNTTLNFSNATIAAGGTCTVAVNVTSSTVGTVTNTTGNVSHIVNAATVNGNTATDTLTVVPPNPSVSLVKRVGLTNNLAGNWYSYLATTPTTPIYYLLTVENTGDVPLNPVTVTDPTVSTAGCTWSNPLTPLPVATAGNDNHISTCIIGPVAASSGLNTNTATASSTYSGTTYTDTSSASYATVGLTLDKATTATSFVLNDVINYTYLVTNSGFAVLSGPVTVTDNKNTVTCPALNTVGDFDNFLDAGESVTCTGSYTIVAGDVVANIITNTATASAGGVTSNTDTVSVPGVPNPLLTIDKVQTSTGPYVVGNTISYTVTAQNTGNVVLTNVTVSDPGLTPNNQTCATLAVNATCVLTGTHVVTQAEFDTGSYVNTATANSTETNTPITDSVTVNFTLAPAMTVDKVETSTGPYTAGGTISYTVTATNTGNQTLTNVVVSDPGLTPNSQTCATLAPNATCVLTGTHTLTAGEVSSGSYQNTATGDSDQTTPVTDSVTVSFTPTLTIDKVQTSTGPYVVGNTISYTVTATNTGNVVLTNVVVSDPGLTPNSQTCATLALNATCVLTGTHVVTQAEFDTGSFVNTGTADSNETTPITDSVTVNFTLAPAMTVDKVETSAPPYTVGGTISYTVTATNTGNQTLTNVVVSDPGLTPNSQTCASVAPTATCVLTGTHTVTAGDVTAGSYVNTGTADSDQTTPVTDSVAVTLTAGLSVDKVETSAPPYTVGGTISYTVTATNTGNITLNNVVVSDPGLTPNSNTCATLAPAATCVLTGTHTVTAGDVTAGSFVNVGTADSNETTPVTDSVTVTLTAGLSVDKVETSTPPYTAGGTISYTVTATNTGNITLNNVVVSDPGLTPNSNTCATLAPAATCVLTGTHTLTAGEVASGSFVNTGTADSDETTPVTDSVTVTLTPSMTIDKVETSTGPYAVGNTISYTVTATNTGNITLNNVVVSDPGLTPNSNTCATVLPTATCVLTGTHVVTQAEFDTGSFVNTGTADSDETAPITDSVTVTFTLAPAMTIDKVETSAGPYTVGGTISYTVTATNTGNQTLTNVVVSDPDLTPNSHTCASVAPGATCVLTGTHTVTLANVGAGSFVNTGTADSDQTTPVTDSVTVNFTPAMTIDKVETSAGPYAVGNTISYTVTATNTGNITLNNVVVSDPGLTPNSQTCATLAINATCVLTGTHVVTQAEFDTGSFVNTGTADSDETTPVTDSVTVTFTRTPAMTVDKVETSSGPYTVGGTISYTITVTNTGNQTLTNVSIIDLLLTPNSQTCVTLAPAATCVLSGTHTVTAADVTAGGVTNTALVTSDQTPPGSDTVTVTLTPAMTIDKVETSAGPYAVGNTINYTVTVTNTGNITLNNVVVSDALLTPSSNTCATLAPAATCVLTGGHVVTQANVDAGTFTNTATGDSNETTPVTDQVIVTFTPAPNLAIDKVETSTGPYAVGGTISYTVTATNTGNITLTSVTVTDPGLTPNSNTCATLAPAATCVLTGTHTVTQANLDAGSFVNTATANSTETNTPITDSVTVTFTPNPDLTIDKVVTTVPPYAVGTVVSYTVTATNTGNVTLNNVTVNDPALTPNNQTCATLAPAATCVLTGTHTVTQADFDAASFVNTATANSTETNTPITDSVTISFTPTPVLNVHKQVTSTGPYNVGDTITYDVIATNNGNMTLTNVVVSDPMFTPNSMTCATLAPTATCVLSGSYVVTAGDAVTGTVTNTGAADSNETPPVDETVIVPISSVPPDLSIVKTNSGNFAIGATGNFTLTVTNNGGGTLGAVTVTDNMPTMFTIVGFTVNPIDWTCGNVGQLITCTYIGNGGIMLPGASSSIVIDVRPTSVGTGANSASVSTLLDTDNTNDLDNNTFGVGVSGPLPTPTPVLAIVDPFITKVANPPFAIPGEVVVWTITVTNPGAVNNNNVRTVDNMPPEVEITNVSATGGSVTSSGQTVDWFKPVLTPGESVTITITTRVRGTTALPFSVTNRAVLTVDGREIMAASAMVSSVATLPATGESPWSGMRVPLMVITVLAVTGGIIVLRRTRTRRA